MSSYSLNIHTCKTVCSEWLHGCVLPKGSSVAVVLLFSTGFALGLISHGFATAGTLLTEWRGGVCSGGTATSEELGWGEEETVCVGVTQSCLLKITFRYERPIRVKHKYVHIGTENMHRRTNIFHSSPPSVWTLSMVGVDIWYTRHRILTLDSLYINFTKALRCITYCSHYEMF